MADQYAVEVVLRGTETVTLKYGQGTAAHAISTVAQLISDYEQESTLDEMRTELVSITVTKRKA